MYSRALWTILVVLVILVTACNPVETDSLTSTRMKITQSEVVIATSAVLTATPTIVVTETPMSTGVPLPTAPVETAKPIASPTSGLKLDLKWSDKITKTLKFAGSNIKWSPTSNKFTYSLLTDDLRSYLYFAEVDTFQPKDITPTALGRYVNVLWHPSGNYFYIDSILVSDPYDTPYGWKVMVSDQVVEEPVPSGAYNWGWLNDNLVISERRVGTGTFSISIIDSIIDQEIANTIFDGQAIDVTEDYVILYDDMQASVAMLAQEPISPEYQGFQHGTNVKYLSKVFYQSIPNRAFRSAFADVLPDTNQVLVITWNEGQFPDVDSILSGDVKTDLQLWDLENNQISMVIPGGAFGRFSYDGNLLFSTVVSDDQLVATLRDRQENIIFQMPISPEFNTVTFSPDSRFLTFFTPLQLNVNEGRQVTDSQIVAKQTYLTIFDIVTGQFLPQIPLEPQTPLWSPDSNKLLFYNNGVYYLLNANSFVQFAISDSPIGKLSNPQWSYDGRYLSLEFCDSYCSGEIFILETPWFANQ